MWGAVMSRVHSGLEPKQFENSSYATERYYCTSTGDLATSSCPSKAIGWYKKSNTPAACKTHGGKALSTLDEIRKAEQKAAEEAAKNASSDSSASSAASSGQ